MAKVFPELVFTRGPQKGRRVPLSKTMNVVGRDRTCDVEIEDEYASRQHARIIVEGARIRLANTSPNGTKVNGKLTEQAVLADGDLLGFGLECEMRLETVPAAAPAGAPPAAAPRPAERAPAPTAEIAAADAPSARKTFKKPSMVVWVGVYLVVLAAVFGMLKILTQRDPVASVRGTDPLSDEQIRAFIDMPIEAVKNPGLADTLRAEAVNLYQQWKAGTTNPDHLYQTVRKFKESLGHQKAEDFALETARTDTGEIMRVQAMFEEVKNELFEEVRIAYKNAYRDQRAGHLLRAAAGYRILQQMVPDYQDAIYKSATEQLNVVNAALLQQKWHSGPRPF